MKQKKPTHLLIRFSDRLLDNRGTIKEHQKVIEKEGAVWFGIITYPWVFKPLLSEQNTKLSHTISVAAGFMKSGSQPTTVNVQK